MQKDKIETICRSAGMRPEKREQFQGYEVFVADGFSLPPHKAYQRFGVDPRDFPKGMYTTLWWVSKGSEKLDTGQPLFFDAFHDRQYSAEDKKRARISVAMQTAKKFLSTRKRLNG